MEKNEIVIFETSDEQVKLNVNISEETVWLNRNQIAELFDRDIKTIGKHINNALKEEIDDSTVANFATVQIEGDREVERMVAHYNLDAVLAVGYRVKSKRGIDPKTLQYLMGHSDIGVTLNTYTHLGLEDAENELQKMEEVENSRKEMEKGKEKSVSQVMFKAI